MRLVWSKFHCANTRYNTTTCRSAHSIWRFFSGFIACCWCSNWHRRQFDVLGQIWTQNFAGIHGNRPNCMYPFMMVSWRYHQFFLQISSSFRVYIRVDKLGSYNDCSKCQLFVPVAIVGWICSWWYDGCCSCLRFGDRSRQVKSHWPHKLVNWAYFQRWFLPLKISLE